MDGLPNRAFSLISARRPEANDATVNLYAATIDGPNTVHEELPPDASNGRRRHEVKDRRPCHLVRWESISSAGDELPGNFHPGCGQSASLRRYPSRGSTSVSHSGVARSRLGDLQSSTGCPTMLP